MDNYGQEIRAMLYGNKDEALKAKRRLMMKAMNISNTNPNEARLLKRITKRIRI